MFDETKSRTDGQRVVEIKSCTLFMATKGQVIEVLVPMILIDGRFLGIGNVQAFDYELSDDEMFSVYASVADRLGTALNDAPNSEQVETATEALIKEDKNQSLH